MRTILAITFLLISQISFSQDAKKKKIETTIRVEGVCDMCKKRIENAAYIKGVKFAEWDKKNKELTLVYNCQKTSINKVQKSLADAGHSSKGYPADEKAYKQLPACCKYADGIESH